MRPGASGELCWWASRAAKSIAYTLDVPCVGLNHLEGHLTAALLDLGPDYEPPRFPYIGLVASGGHSDLYRVSALRRLHASWTHQG